MPEYVNDKVKINKVHSKPKRGHKLGTALATWEKIKLAASTGSEETENKENDDGEKNECLVESGEDGEIFILHKPLNVLEVWGWKPPGNEANGIKPLIGDTLYVQKQFYLNTGTTKLQSDDCELRRKFVCYKVVRLPDELYYTLLAISRNPKDGHYALEVHNLIEGPLMTLMQRLEFPDVMQHDTEDIGFSIRTSHSFVVVSSNQGFLYVFKLHDGKYVPANHDMGLHSIRKSSCQCVLDHHPLLISLKDDELVLKTSAFDGEAIFDLVGNWLVYSPTKEEYHYVKAVHKSNGKLVDSFTDEELDPISNSIDKDPKDHASSIFTPVKLPSPGPLLNLLISTLSNTALDGLYRLSEVSSTKVKAYLNKDKDKAPKTENADMIQSLNSLGKAVGKILYSTASNTASTIQKKTMSLKPNNNQLIKIIDLSNDKIMAIFKPPGGVSHVSLSPFDLQLVQANYRGDSFFMWDLYKLPSEISLLGKFVRGKTSSVIREILWFINNYDNSCVVQGNNIGFGCITKANGSVHWFNVNYLTGDLSNNHPNNLIRDNLEAPTKKMLAHFLDAWVLSALQAKKFLTLPNISNNINNKYDLKSKFRINQLAVLDSENQVMLISPLNGDHIFKYNLPRGVVNPDIFPDKNKKPTIKKNCDSTRNKDTTTTIPLSQTEIETCSPYLNLINSKNVEFSVYDFDDSTKTDYNNFFDVYTRFDHTIPISTVKVNDDSTVSSSLVSTDQFRDKLTLHQEPEEDQVDANSQSSQNDSLPSKRSE